jgi:metal-responsive CopG/Arc/MetJ family transcriptional regulator
MKRIRKGTLGIPDLWDEVKRKVSMTLTPTAIKGLDELASVEGISRSEFVERIGRRIFAVNTKPE